MPSHALSDTSSDEEEEELFGENTAKKSTSSPNTTTSISKKKNVNNNNNNIKKNDKFELIDEVEWGPRKDEEGYDTDQELAPKPRRKPVQDACGCFPPKTGLACLDDSCVLYACREECRSNCDAGPICGNKRLQKKEFADVEVFDAGIKGNGLKLSKTTKDAKKGDILCEYTGRAIREAALNRLFRRYKLDRRLYILSLGDGIYIDAREKGGYARYINHSCRPNCKVELWNVKGVMRAAVVALQRIKPGEELTFDYQWERKRGRAPTKCHCGYPECRGTLEMPKSLEEQDLQRELEGHWEQTNTIDETLVNRTVQIYSKEHQEYFMGEVTGYDIKTGMHSILYRQDLKENWEDLKKEDFMILNEEYDKEHFMIAKKVQKRRPSPTSSLLTGTTIYPLITKNYLYVQTRVKENLWSMHLIERCQRNCNVQIQADQFAKPPTPCNVNDAEDVEKHAALDASLDGTVWKLTVTGCNVSKAVFILQKNVAFIERKFAMDGSNKLMIPIPANTNQAASAETTTASTTASTINTNNVAAATASAAAGATITPDVHEVIFPRIIADAVKRSIHTVRENCRSVNIHFAPSESKSKEFSKLHIEGTVGSDIEIAKEHLWVYLVTLCLEHKAPTSPFNIPLNLGFLGGTLSNEQFNLLSARNNSKPGTPNRSRSSMRASEDMNDSPFIKSFEGTYQCTVWVQAQEDQGRINSSNQIVNEADPDGPRKIYFGCKPSEVARLSALIKLRADELARGVKYIHLGGDRVYMKLMVRDGGRFFEFVKSVSGATVAVDPMTGDHIRIDGKLVQDLKMIVNVDESTANMSEVDRVALAEEIVRLQVECFRDKCIREQPWIFGRDWTLTPIDMETDVAQGNLSTFTTIGKLDKKSVNHCGMEIAEIMARLEMTYSVGGHAALILYRFVHSNRIFSTQFKTREAILACVFIAVKAQQVSRLKTLYAVLEAGYETFYPGARFDPDSEEVSVLEDRVLAAEKEILETLEYDVFWKEMELIQVASLGSGGMSSEHIEDVMKFVFSGPVLSAGAELWLKYGIEYVFAASAAFLKADLATLIPALSLVPLKVSQAAKLIVNSAKYGRPSNERTPSNPLLESRKEKLEKYIPRIEQKCLILMTSMDITSDSAVKASATEYRYKIIGQQGNEYLRISGIPKDDVQQRILPLVEGIAAESSCRIYISEGQSKDTEDLLLCGPWRSTAIADYLLRCKVEGHVILPDAQITFVDFDKRVTEQAKTCPGCLDSKDILISDGWRGTIQDLEANSDCTRLLGGKCCVPGKISGSALRHAGLRWWIPPSHGPPPSGLISEMCVIRLQKEDNLQQLAQLAASMASDPGAFPKLITNVPKTGKSKERFMPVSTQRWPPEKISKKEAARLKKCGKKAKDVVGFSVAALQEMQMFKQLHSVIPSPHGHPNFIVPVGVALPSIENDERENTDRNEDTDIFNKDLTEEDPIFSLFRSNEDNRRTEKKKKEVESYPNIVYQPTPFILQRFMSRKRRGSEENNISESILMVWFHDCLSALVHCHTNHVLMRTILSDHIVIDQSGVAKIGALYRCTVLSPSERHTVHSPDKAIRSAKSHKGKQEDDFSGNPYAAPELLLGCPKQSKESDVWALGCLFSHLLLGRPLFVGKDRESLLLSIYKVVGTPSTAADNYGEAKDYPHYFKLEKKYKRGVQKAFAHLLKDEASKFGKAIDLISRMLHLDPRKRCTAAEALAQDYMTECVEKIRSLEFRRNYVDDWMAMKGRIMQSSEEDRRQRDEEKTRKRAAIMIAASKSSKGGGVDDDGDDLYDIDDLFPSSSPKKPRSERSY